MIVVSTQATVSCAAFVLLQLQSSRKLSGQRCVCLSTMRRNGNYVKWPIRQSLTRRNNSQIGIWRPSRCSLCLQRLVSLPPGRLRNEDVPLIYVSGTTTVAGRWVPRIAFASAKFSLGSMGQYEVRHLMSRKGLRPST